VLLRRHCLATAGSGRLLHEVVDLTPAFAGEGDERLGVARGVADLARGESLEERFGQQHDVAFVADDHAGGLVVRELGS
jgi:hypothetical protein